MEVMKLSKDELKRNIKLFRKETNIGKMVKVDLQAHLLYLLQHGQRKPQRKGQGIGDYLGVVGKIGESLFSGDDGENSEEEARREDQERAAAFEEEKTRSRQEAEQREKDTKDEMYNINRRNNIFGNVMNEFRERGIIKPKEQRFERNDAINRTEQQRRERLEREREAEMNGGGRRRKR